MSNKQHDPLGLAAKSPIVGAVAGPTGLAGIPGDPGTGQVFSVDGLDAPVRGQASAPAPKEQKPRSFIILIRNAKTGTLHTVTRGSSGIVVEFEDMEQAANLALTLPVCKVNPFSIAPCYE